MPSTRWSLLLLFLKTRLHKLCVRRPAFARGSGLYWRMSKRKRLLLLLLLRRRALIETPQRRRRWHLRPTFQRRSEHGFWYTSVPTMRESDPEKFFNYFRMSPDRFDHLLGLVSPHIRKFSWREPVPPGERLALTLRYLAAGGSMMSISYQFLLGVSTVSAIIRDTCCVIWRVLGPRVFPTISEGLWKSIASDYDRFWQFPNCLGAIDGKHCVAQKFAGGASNYFNYKGSYSIVLLALCDAQYRFTIVDIGARGRRSDGGVLSSSDFGRKLFANDLQFPPPCTLPGCEIVVPHVIVGDEAFPLTEHIMTPFPGEMLDDHKIIFNYRLSRARRVTENSFGVLSARWQILRKTIVASEATANAVVQACVCLHNFLMDHELNLRPRNIHYLPPGYVDTLDNQGGFVPGRWREENPQCMRPLDTNMRMGARNFTRAAQDIREDFVDYFLDIGQVAWQWEKLPRRQALAP